MSQDEHIIVYAQEAPDQPIVMSRTDYYDNRYGKYKGRYCAIVDIFLFNRRGEMLLQKRARNKKNSPGLLHTTVGGHINEGEEASFSVVHECMEELGAAALAYPPEAFGAAYAKLGAYADRAALLCSLGDHYLDYPAEEARVGNIQDRIWFYLGRYDGPVENPDHSCAGYEWLDLAAYEKELDRNPKQFTYPFKVYMEKFGPTMAEFVKKYCPDRT